MVLRVNGEHKLQETRARDQQDVTTVARKLGEDQAAAAPSGLDRDAATSSPRRLRPAPSTTTASSSPLKAAAQARDGSARSTFQLDPPSDHRLQLDAAAAVFASLPKPDDTRSAGFVRPAPICTNPSGNSPTQDRPRGWQAMLQSPTQPDDQTMADVDQQQILQLSPAEPEQQQQPLPVLSPAADSDIPDLGLHFGISSSGGTPFAAAAPAPAGPLSGGLSRPSPLVLPDNSSSRSGASANRITSASPASRFSALRIASPASSAPAAAAAVRPHAMARPDLRILPPLSPCDTGCVTPTALLSPSRPYSGPRITEADVDYDLIDGIAGVDPSNPISSSSSPNLAAAAGSAVYSRSGGLRSSRDTDLRRMAMTNQLLHSPRPPVLAITGSGPQAMFTGETRARALNSNISSSSSGNPAAAEGSSEPGSETGSPALVPALGDTPPPHAVQLQRLYQQSLRGSQLSSPASTASTAGPSILATTSGTRSLPGTPGTLQQRYTSAAAAVPSSSSSSSMTMSPVPPPTHGPAAALLAGAVGVSPRTPRSPLSVMYSPYSGRMVQSAAGTPLPLPLFMMNNASGGSSAGGSPVPAAAGTAALPPSGRSSLSNIGAGLFSPPHLSSRLRRENSGPPMVQVAAAEADRTAQRMEEDSPQQQQQQGLAASSDPSSDPSQQLQQQVLPEHYQQVLRQRLQVTDTRYGPHGESPLSPSHHSHMLQQQQQQQQGPNESLLSPTRPTPLVQPVTAAAAAGTPDAAAAAAAVAAGRVVGDVGRRDIHEWLDQHSWSLMYELPHNLRDAADFARNQRHSIRSLTMDPCAAAAATGEGYMPAQQQQQQEFAVSAGTRSDWPATASEQQPQQLPAHPTAPAAAGSSSHSRPLDWAFGDLTVSVDQSGPSVSNLSSAASSSSSRLGPLGLQGLPANSILGYYRSDASHSPAYHGRGRRGGVPFRHSASSIGDVCAADAAWVQSGIHVVADSRLSGHSGPVQHAASFGAAADSDAAIDTPITTTAAETMPNSSSSSSRASSSSGSNSSSTRLLCPGSHRYMPGSPVAEHSCCCSCPPGAGASEEAPEAAAAAIESARGVGTTTSSSSSSSINNATAAAELLRSSMAAVAASQGSYVYVSRPINAETTDVVLSRDSRQIGMGSPGTAAVGSTAVELSPATPALHVMQRLLHACAPTSQRQQEEKQRVQGTVTGHIADSAAAAAGAIDADGMLGLSCGQVFQQQQQQQQALPVSSGKLLTAADRSPVLLSLLHDERYIIALLSSLPGVDPAAPEIQQAVQQLRVMLLQQQQEYGVEEQ